MSSPQDDRLADDLLDGAEAIAKFLGFKTSSIFWQVSQGKLPVTRMGNRIIGSKTRLRQHFTGSNPKTAA
jgi:hypothetical protein